MIEHLTLRRGGEAYVVAADAEFVTLECAAPSPPGSTLELELAGAPISVKVRSCRKTPEQTFRIEGRWVSLSRVQRDAVLDLGVTTTPKDTPAKIPE